MALNLSGRRGALTVTTLTVLPESYHAKEEHDDAEDDTSDQLWRHI